MGFQLKLSVTMAHHFRRLNTKSSFTRMVSSKILVSPYHPSSNGPAKRSVQTFKHALDASASDPARSLQQRIQNFLLFYWSTPHATTGSSPCKLFLQQELKTPLSLTKPDLARRVATPQGKMKFYHDRHAKVRELSVGDTILARDHLLRQKWQPGTVLKHSAHTLIKSN